MAQKRENSPNPEERKLWIGNLDARINEYQLLKLVQIHGIIEKFDLIFHRSGPLIGLPRGYAFVTYKNSKDAIRAKNCLNGKLVGSKNITVTWANSTEAVNSSNESSKNTSSIPALALSKDKTIKLDRISQIQAIEAKLKLMERKEDELKINDSVSSKPFVLQQFQFNKSKNSDNSNGKSPLTLHLKTQHRHKPYKL